METFKTIYLENISWGDHALLDIFSQAFNSEIRLLKIRHQTSIMSVDFLNENQIAAINFLRKILNENTTLRPSGCKIKINKDLEEFLQTLEEFKECEI
jgi:hypothetical protein